MKYNVNCSKDYAKSIVGRNIDLKLNLWLFGSTKFRVYFSSPEHFVEIFLWDFFPSLLKYASFARTCFTWTSGTALPRSWRNWLSTWRITSKFRFCYDSSFAGKNLAWIFRLDPFCSGHVMHSMSNASLEYKEIDWFKLNKANDSKLENNEKKNILYNSKVIQ